MSSVSAARPDRRPREVTKAADCSAASAWPQLAEGECCVHDRVEADVDDEQCKPATGGQARCGKDAHGCGASTVAAFQRLERPRAMSMSDVRKTSCKKRAKTSSM